ncbi:MAG TPA: hypothetical protein VKF38_01645 [Anaerolineaceae bacterium]|nr:hypothetical protein [Anaerolineaceae bacterium]
MALNPQKHLYPLKIALRAQKLIQGSLFYDIFVDAATWQYVVTVPNAERTIMSYLINSAGWSEETYEISWACFKDYWKEFQNPIHQHAVYSMISHWDWFISNLGKFIDFAEKSFSPDKQTDKNLLKLNLMSFTKQIEIVKKETGISLPVDDDTLDLIEEMNLVRNLGMHNEWEVDETYLKKTKTNRFKPGDKRVFDIPELTKWHSAFLQLIGALATEIAVNYAQVPKYE